jgi:hypothetical protein
MGIINKAIENSKRGVPEMFKNATNVKIDELKKAAPIDFDIFATVDAKSESGSQAMWIGFTTPGSTEQKYTWTAVGAIVEILKDEGVQDMLDEGESIPVTLYIKKSEKGYEIPRLMDRE